MGAQGFSNSGTPLNWETNITSGCTTQTKNLAAPPIGTGSGPVSVWPATCNPDGMAIFLNQFSPPNPPGEPAVHWITFKTTDQPTALSELIVGLQSFGSPGVVPIYGQADHWVTVNQVTSVTATGAIFNVKGFDGGMLGGTDSSGTSYFSGPQSWAPIPWKNTFFTVVIAINPSCDSVPNGGCGAPPVNDPFANKYLLMFEPPELGTNALPAPVTFATVPGVVGKGEMNETVAQVRVMDALVAGGIDSDAELWNGVKSGTPGAAFHVAGVWPSGAAWDYYLVPILSTTNANTAIGFVQLDAADGAFQSMNMLTTPVQFTPVAMTKAQQIASSVLVKGESLTGGLLTWNPRTNSQLAKSPGFPYYEFGIAGATTKSAKVRVRLNDGMVVRSN